MKIIDSGHSSTFQGLWKYKNLELGRPVGGAVDPVALRQANRLVGNPEDALCIEMTLRGVTVMFEHDALIALTGANLDPRLNGERISNYTSHIVHSGDYLCLSDVQDFVGQHTYLAVSGGFLNVSSGDRLMSGGNVATKGTDVENFEVKYIFTPIFVDEDITLRVIPGPNADKFTEEALRRFYTGEYTVDSEPDRAVLHLQGERLSASSYKSADRPCVVGSICVDETGQPQITLPDAPAMSDELRIATVATADMSIVAGLTAGMKVRFRPITVEQAQGLYRRRAKDAEQALCHKDDAYKK